MSGSCGACVQLPRVPLDLGYKTKLGLGHEGVEGILHPDAQFPPTGDSEEPPGSSATRFHVCARALSARAVSRVNRQGARRSDAAVRVRTKTAAL